MSFNKPTGCTIGQTVTNSRAGRRTEGKEGYIDVACVVERDAAEEVRCVRGAGR